ncbi:hypothetical protein [Streptomyces avermitilis]|uniref:hypothetical protein n=1 Tax=Streptomyces avermitilis TaxID=33903 RepID=UPI0038247AD3
MHVVVKGGAGFDRGLQPVGRAAHTRDVVPADGLALILGEPLPTTCSATSRCRRLPAAGCRLPSRSTFSTATRITARAAGGGRRAAGGGRRAESSAGPGDVPGGRAVGGVPCDGTADHEPGEGVEALLGLDVDPATRFAVCRPQDRISERYGWSK